MDKLLIHANNEYKFNEHIRVGVDLFYHNYSKMEIVMILFRFSNFCSKTDPISAAWDKDREFLARFILRMVLIRLFLLIEINIKRVHHIVFAEFILAD